MAAELKAKADAELKEKQRLEAEAKAKIEAEKKAAKAPVKEKLSVWINSLSTEIPNGLEKDNTALLIQAKFESFKVWANQQIESL